MAHDRTIYETLDRLESRARRGSRIAERVLWETIAREASADIKEQLPVMYETWKVKQWAIKTILFKVRFNTWKDKPSHDTIISDLGDLFDASQTEDKTARIAHTLNSLIESADLTQAQIELINLVREGYTQTEIAKIIGVSQSVVSERFAEIVEKIRESADRID